MMIRSLPSISLVGIVISLLPAPAMTARAELKIQNPYGRGCLSAQGASDRYEIEAPLAIMLANEISTWKKKVGIPKFGSKEAVSKWKKANPRKSALLNSDPLADLYAYPIMPPVLGNPRYSFEFEKDGESSKKDDDGLELVKRDAFLELYWRPSPTTYRLVPGLGIGASSDERTWVYFCLNLPDSDEGSELVIHFLDAQADVTTETVQVKTKTIKLELDPIKGTIGLLLGPTRLFVPQSSKELSDFDSKMVQKNEFITTTFFKAILSNISEVGVSRIQVTPRQFTLDVKTRWLRLLPINSQMVHELDSFWMIKPQNQRKVFGRRLDI